MSEKKPRKPRKPRPKKVPLGEEEVSIIQADPYCSTAEDWVERAVEWWDPLRIAAGGVTLIDGDPGTGKTMLLAHVAAHVSRGTSPHTILSQARWNRQGVLIISEANIETIWKPRLKWAGANMSRIRFWGRIPGQPYHPPQLPDCLPQIRKSIDLANAGLVVWDTVSSCMTKYGTTGEKEIRSAMDPLNACCQETGIICLCTRHLTKQMGASPLQRGAGGMAMVGSAQTALLLTMHVTDPTKRMMCMTKSNLEVLALPRQFTIAVDDGRVSIVWGDEVNISPEEMLRGELEKGHRDAVEDARRFLRAYLEEGPRPAADCLKAAEQAGLKLATLRIAKASLDIPSYLKWDTGERYWEWHPPVAGWPKGLEWKKPE